ncbi:NAD(P)-dependent oxidoreductase [bacterium SCSIO 12827]|nr:NAD(P)-dependent oxidoreductase [bacterium SCSIO 12827]
MARANTPRLGFIGFGEAGPLIAKGLLAAGLPAPITARDLRERPPVGGVEMAASIADLVATSDIILSTVTATEALEVAQEAARALKPGQIYMDLNSTSPMVKQQIAEVVNPTGARFVEVAVMDGVPGKNQKVPMLLVGTAAKDVIEAFTPYGVNMREFGTEYGRAAATKMFRSVLVKGMEALLQECVLGAETYGVADEVFASMNRSYAGKNFDDLAHFLIGRTAIHGARRGHELEEAADTLRALGYDAFMCDGGAKRLKWLSEFGFKEDYGDDAPEDYREVFAELQKRRASAGP